MYTVDSSLVGSVAGTGAAWIAALDALGVADSALIVGAYVSCGNAAGIDWNLALGQACDECNWFRYERWTRNHNPAGIGITGDAVLGVDFGSIERGVQAHIALLCCYAMGSTPAVVAGWGVLESFGFGGFQRDRPRLGDLDGAWAVPGDGYAAKIAAIANQVVGGATVATVAVFGSAVVAAARAHLGQVREFDTWNGEHDVSNMCEADVEDWYTEAGVTVPHYPTAAAAGDASPLFSGPAPAGAQVFFRGPGWSPNDHTGISVGGALTISGLSTVVILGGWQDLPSYRGWRFPAGVIADPSGDASAIRMAPGNPYPDAGMEHPFSSRWFQLDGMGLALPMMGWPVAAETITAAGRRIQRFERGWYGVQPAPAPWDVVELLPVEWPSADGKG